MFNAEDKRKMDKEQMIAALSRLNEKLQETDEMGELILFGGAVMCLVFGSRGYTRDIDAIFEPKSSIYAYAREIAQEYEKIHRVHLDPTDLQNPNIQEQQADRNKQQAQKRQHQRDDKSRERLWLQQL